MAARGRRRSVGLALGAGGARGLAHIGVLKKLAEADIPIDAIAGTSSGALVGAIYAAGQLENFERLVREFEWTDVLAMWDPVWPRSGIMSGERALESLAGVVGDWKIEDLPIPFAAVSVDLVTGQEVLTDCLETCDLTGKRVRAPLLGVCEASGRRLLRERLVTCPASGRRVHPDEARPTCADGDGAERAIQAV